MIRRGSRWGWEGYRIREEGGRRDAKDRSHGTGGQFEKGGGPGGGEIFGCREEEERISGHPRELWSAEIANGHELKERSRRTLDNRNDATRFELSLTAPGRGSSEASSRNLKETRQSARCSDLPRKDAMWLKISTGIEEREGGGTFEFPSTSRGGRGGDGSTLYFSCDNEMRRR